jgi:thiamine biosynthesis lipoprotein
MKQEFEFIGKAMGTDYAISIICDSKKMANNASLIARQQITNYEKQFSRFIKTSELSLLNLKKRAVVSSTFFKVTKKAFELFKETKGIFNPLVQVSRLGYNKNFSDLQDDQNLEDETDYNIDFSTTILDQYSRLIYLQEGQKLDFGGFLKGYLAELIAKQIMASNIEITGVIVNLGGDVYTQGLDANNNLFTFSIYNPILDNNETTVELFNQGLATSGTYKRSWLHKNKKVHHILDESGLQNPINQTVSATVIHTDGARAEAYSKVFLSMEHEQALKLLNNPNIKFITINNSGLITTNTQ